MKTFNDTLSLVRTKIAFYMASASLYTVKAGALKSDQGIECTHNAAVHLGHAADMIAILDKLCANRSDFESMERTLRTVLDSNVRSIGVSEAMQTVERIEEAIGKLYVQCGLDELGDFRV